MPDGGYDTGGTIGRRTRLVSVLAVTAAVAAFLLEYILSQWSDRPFGHTQEGHLLGWLGLIMVLVVFAYPAQKQLRPNRVWSKPWLYLHEILGILGPLVILVHSGAHFHALVPVLALLALALVVLSGIAGEVLHALAFRTLYDTRHELTQQGTTEEAIQARLQELASQEGILRWWPWVHVPLTGAFVVLTLMHIGGALYFGGV